MNNLDIICLVNGFFSDYQDQFQHLLPQALFFQADDLLQNPKAIADKITETLKVRNQALRSLSVHLIGGLDDSLSLSDLKTMPSFKSFLPDFEHNQTYLHLYIDEQNKSTQPPFEEEELSFWTTKTLLFGSHDSDDYPIREEETIANMARTISCLPYLGTSHQQSKLMTAWTKSLSFTPHETSAYYRHKLTEGLVVYLQEQKKSLNPFLTNLKEEVNQYISKQEEAIVQKLSPYFSDMEKETYNSNYIVHSFDEGTQISLEAAEEKVFRLELSKRHKKFEDFLFLTDQELEPLLKKEIETLQEELILSSNDRLTSDFVMRDYGFQTGLFFGVSELLKALIKELSQELEELEVNNSRLEKEIKSSLKTLVCLESHKVPGFLGLKKKVPVSDWLVDDLVNNVYKKKDSLIRKKYLVMVLENNLSILKNWSNGVEATQLAYSDLTENYQLPTFPDGLEREFIDALDYDAQDFIGKLEKQVPQLWRENCLSSNQDLIEEEYKKALDILIKEEEVPSFDDLLAGDSTLKQRVLRALESKQVFPLRLLGNPLSLKEEHIFLSTDSCLFEEFNQDKSKQVHRDYHEDRSRILSLKVYENIQLTHLYAFNASTKEA